RNDLWVWKRLELFGALAIVPATVGAELYLRHAGPLPLAAAGSGVVLAGIAAFVLRRPSELSDLVLAARARESELLRQREELQARVDVLSAEREISLIVNEELDFRTILERVLSITCDTLGGNVELWLKEGDQLVPRAARRNGETSFDLEEAEDARVRQCLEDGRVLLDAEDGRFHALAPLQADREIIGVVRVTSLLEENAAAREERSK